MQSALHVGQHPGQKALQAKHATGDRCLTGQLVHQYTYINATLSTVPRVIEEIPNGSFSPRVYGSLGCLLTM